MKIKVTITEKATGKKVERILDNYHDLDLAKFVYTEGNRSCNCSLAEEFDGDENNECLGPREFTVHVEEIDQCRSK